MLAIEILPISPDRPPLPNWGQGAAPARAIVPAERLLAILDRLASSLPPTAMAALRGAAASGANGEVVVAGGKAPAQILVAGQRIVLTGAARDAVLAFGGESAAALQAEVSRPSGIPAAPDVAALARAAVVEAQVAGLRAQPPSFPEVAAPDPGSGTAPGSGAPTAATVALRQPLFVAVSGGAPSGVTLAGELARAVENSGLFLESHLVSWVQGKRPLQQVQAESRALLADAVAASPPDPQAWEDQRAALQADAMQQQAFALRGQAWPGQGFRLEIAQDGGRGRAAAGPAPPAGVFTATLSMALPNLGAIHAKIRVAASAVGVEMESSNAAALRETLGALASALDARGLTVAQLTVHGAVELPGGAP